MESSQHVTVLGPDGSPIAVQVIKDGQQISMGSPEDHLPSTPGHPVKVVDAQPILSELTEATPVMSTKVTSIQVTSRQVAPIQVASTQVASMEVKSTHVTLFKDSPVLPQPKQNADTTSSATKIKSENQNDNTPPFGDAPSEDTTLWPLIDTVSGLLYCTRCSYSTDKKQNWYKHRQTHLGSKRHQCSECSYETGSASNMKRHLQQHSGNKMFKCGVCDASFHQKTHLQRHHQKAHVERKYPCTAACGFSAVTEEEASRHFERKHKDLVLLPGPQVSQRHFMCPHCNFIDIDRKLVQQHMKFHSLGQNGRRLELKLYCTQCSFVTDCASKLKRHQLVHNRQKPFLCKICHYKANQREHVVRHLRSKHRIIIPPHRSKASVPKPKPVAVAVSTDENIEQSISSSENRLIKQSGMPGQLTCGTVSWDKLFACNFCSMTFSKLLSLYKHVHAQHQEHTVNLNPLSCVICEFSGTSHKTLLAHMRRHTASEEAKMAATAASAVSQKKTTDAPNTRTVMLNLSQGLDVPIVVDVPRSSHNDEEVLLQKANDEIMFLGELADDDAADLEASLSGSQIIEVGDTEENMEELTTGDLIQINGETYKVEMDTTSLASQ